MNIDEKLLARLETLSSLNIDESKKEDMIKNLGEIVAFVENLNELDVSKIEATFTTLSGGTPMQEDEVVSNPEVAQSILKNAPKSEDGYFIVPKIIE